MRLNIDEKKLIEHAKIRVPKLLKLRRKKGVYDTLFAFLMSDSGNIYEGIPLLTDMFNGTIHAETNAIANMRLKETEKAKIRAIFIVSPEGKGGNLTPCGMCRAIIHQYSSGKATVLCSQAYMLNTDFDFSKLFKSIRKFTIKELYPEPWTEGKWD
jgi:cytidine deaminase